MGLHFRAVAAFVFLLAIILGSWWIDFLLFTATAEFFARRAFHSWPWIAPLACVFSPLIVLLIEIGISLKRELAREQQGWIKGASLGWTAAGVVFAAVIPMAAVATMPATQPTVSDPGLVAELRLQTAVLALLAFAGHLLILFGGRSAHDSKAFAAFKIRQLSLRRRLRRIERHARRKAAATVEIFDLYHHGRKAFNRRFPDQALEFGPFDRATRELINREFGFELIVLVDEEDEHSRPSGDREPRPPQKPGRDLYAIPKLTRPRGQKQRRRRSRREPAA